MNLPFFSPSTTLLAFGGAVLLGGTQDTVQPTRGFEARSVPGSSYAWADFDSDGYRDALVTTANGRASLLQGLPDGTLEQADATAGLADLTGVTGAAWADFDSDGDPDLFLGGTAGFSRLLENVDGVFVDTLDLQEVAFVHAAEWLDYDGDRDLDLLLQISGGDLLLRNEVASSRGFKEFRLPVPPAIRVPAGEMTPGLEEDLSAELPPKGIDNPASIDRRRTGASSRGSLPRTDAGTTTLNMTGSLDTFTGICARTIIDQATGACLRASSVPTAGMLYPLGEHLSFDDVNNGEAIIGLPGIPGRVRISTPGGFPGFSVDPNDGTTPHAIQFFNGSIALNPDGGSSELVVRDNGQVSMPGSLEVGQSGQPWFEAIASSFGGLPSFRAARADGTSLSYTGQVSAGGSTGYGDWCSDSSSFGRAGHYYLPSTDQGVVFADVKNFRQSNPQDPSTDIVYACVEGPEAAAYMRGTATLVQGVAVVSLPQHFSDVAASEGMTVQLTPRSAGSLGLAVVESSAARFTVRELHAGSGSYEFDWEVKAVRRGYEGYQVIREKLRTPQAAEPVSR